MGKVQYLIKIKELIIFNSGGSNFLMSGNNKVLIVEDDQISKEVMSMFLKGIYDIDQASTADGALELVNNNVYSAILMDVNLGRGKTGLDLTKIIKAMPEHKEVPIIAITAFAMKGDKEEFLSVGMDYYMSKPFSREELLATLKKAIK